MGNRKCFYLVEGQCEEKLINALKESPALVVPGKVKKFNAITNELTNSQLMTFSPGSRVVLVFDTDIELTKHLKKNIELLKTQCSRVEVLTIPQVLNFENEIERSTDVSKAQELTKSKGVNEFKRAVNNMKTTEFRRTLERHKFDISLLWIKKPPRAFEFASQDSKTIK